jgi:hypothetical protein
MLWHQTLRMRARARFRALFVEPGGLSKTCQFRYPLAWAAAALCRVGALRSRRPIT